MLIDKFGQHVYSEKELCDLYMANTELRLKNVLVSDKVQFDSNLNLEDIPNLIEYAVSDKSIEEFDNINRNNWFIPKEYLEFDIAKYVLDKCTCEAELQRAGEELLMYQERDMFILLQYLKYLVDTMRKHNIVWGVGRGSSVSSFVLYLIGIHRINSLQYQLSIDEFLK